MVRAVVIGLAAGCAGGDDGLTLDGDPASDDDESCIGAETFVAGVSKVTEPGGRTVAIGSADPTPPDVGDNAWIVQVSDAGGPVEGLSLELTPWMPLHAHGLTPPTYRATDDGEGSYTLEPFDLVMPGLWEFRLDVGAGETTPDEALFKFCAEG